MIRLLSLTSLLIAGLLTAAAPAATETVRNPTSTTFENALVRLKTPAPGETTMVSVDGKAVPFQTEGKTIWVAPTLQPGESITYQISRAEGKADQSGAAQFTTNDEKNYGMLTNQALSLRLGKMGMATDQLQAPITFTHSTDAVLGHGRFHTDLPLEKVAVTPLSVGPLFARAQVRYEFDAKVLDATTGEQVPAFAEVTVTLPAHEQYALIEESHMMQRGDYWTLPLNSNYFKPTQAVLRRWYDKAFSGAPKVETFAVEPGYTRLTPKVINLQPRWTQAYDEGFFFGVTDDTTLAGALVLRAGKWHWPHDNLIEAMIPERGAAHLQLPTFRGKRYWLLYVGEKPEDIAAATHHLARTLGFGPLDKLHNDYILEWDGADEKPFGITDFYSNNTNPTGMIRGMGRRAVAEAGKTKHSIGALYDAQVHFDPDWYGRYQEHWSSINPNFYTDFIKPGLGKMANVRNHPRFDELRQRAEEALRADVINSVTLPGGAGQECPGYLAHAMSQWADLAPMSKQYLSFDPTDWPQYKAGASFILRSAHPDGSGGRKFHPAGDTHPGRPDPEQWAAKFGVRENSRTFKTEELPGFGVVFRDRPGTSDETYLSFKAGPNRGHYHGDQLSLHYIAHSKPLAIDHQVSYSPRAGQEHTHNRVSFGTREHPFANMDGHERLIAFQSNDEASVAIGQVESERLRPVKEFPPEDWDNTDTVPLAKPLTYRRTVVHVKNRPIDYFVVRDEWQGPALTATFNLHVKSGGVKRDGSLIRFGNDLTVFVAEPGQFEFDEWHSTADGWLTGKKAGEATKGARLSVTGDRGAFITVLYPDDAKNVRFENTDTGVRVHFGDSVDDIDLSGEGVIVKRGDRKLIAVSESDIDLNRSQGNVGLFVPDVGYPFGPAPDWLIEQRAPISHANEVD